MPRRFLIDEAGLDDGMLRLIYRALVTWATERGDRYELTIQPGLYRDPEELRRLERLGTVAAVRQGGGPVAHWLAQGHDVEQQVSGHDMDLLRIELLRETTSVEPRSSELSPVEDARVFAGQRVLYSLHDYGRTQLVSGSDEEIAEVRARLAADGAGDALVPAPGPDTRA